MTHWGNHSDAQDGALWNKMYFLQREEWEMHKRERGSRHQTLIILPRTPTSWHWRLVSCESNCSEVFSVIKDWVFYSLFSAKCRWRRGTSQRSARGVLEVWWIRQTSWRSSILLFLQGSYIIFDRYFQLFSRPEDRVNKLSEQLANTEGKIGDLKILLII